MRGASICGMRRKGATSLDEPLLDSTRIGGWFLVRSQVCTEVPADADDQVPASADDADDQASAGADGRIGAQPQCFPTLGMQTSQRL